MFKFDPINLPVATREDGPTGRFYITPEGNRYPSVTGITALAGEMFGKPDYLSEWRERVGEKEADRISRSAAERGTKLHEAIETLLLGRKPSFSLTETQARDLFVSIRPTIEKNVGVIRGIEIPLWSNKFRLAGTCDFIGEWNGELSIVDWKTSSRFKSPEEIPGYWMQTAIYAFCLYELTGIIAKQLVICLTTGDGPQVHVSDPKPYLRLIPTLRRLYAEKKNETDYLDFIDGGNCYS